MTAPATADVRARGARNAGARQVAGAWAMPALLVAGLAAIVALRWAAARVALDPLAVGGAFGGALVALAWTRPSRPRADNVVVGVVAGLALVGLTTLGAALAGSNLPPGLGRPAAPFLPWAAVTILVATGEEALLRGRLFDATRSAGGALAAIVLTTAAFALLHVPLYGWHVVPLDLGVGLGFAGLRLLTKGVAAPAAAHAVADLATWLL
ncbi:MAG TPA: CPBP family intramembrane glutamic endopeptidase [Candidatus Limnocylindrales bacterium]|nr:CPBP family intramembrane glutamic endopeptidase [Candidatus Limnocylindrales bacterium]